MTRPDFPSVAAIVVLVCVCALGVTFLVGGLGATEVEPVEPTIATTTTAAIVLPTCAELDAVGYDGLASCVNSDGQIVRPGG